MEFVDHYPWSPTDDEHRALISDITAILDAQRCQMNITVPVAPVPLAPVVPPPVAPALPTPTRFLKRYGVVYCAVCDLAVPFCKGHAPPGPPDPETSLARRIRDARGGR